jgi:hypothetical protein
MEPENPSETTNPPGFHARAGPGMATPISFWAEKLIWLLFTSFFPEKLQKILLRSMFRRFNFRLPDF